MTFTIHPHEAARAVRKAQRENRLGYQRGHDKCRYRYDDGAVCAVGAAIPDEVYDTEFETLRVATLLRRETALVCPPGAEDVICHLQGRHDNLIQCPCVGEARKRQLAEFEAAIVACENWDEEKYRD